jgi:tRNA (guanine37-N1)-methyltransferase
MKKFSVLSIFPKMVEGYCEESMLKKAKEKGLVDFEFIDVREYSEERHKKVDDRPYGGGPGMVMQAEVFLKAVENICHPQPLATKEASKITPNPSLNKEGRKSKKTKVILFAPGGKKLDTALAKSYAKKYDHFILLCGRYEGIDSRIEKILKPEKISIGDYVLTGGELPAAVFIDTVSRQVPGVLGDYDSLEENREIRAEFYTRPEVLEWKGKKYKVPKVLISGNHKEIERWRKGV